MKFSMATIMERALTCPVMLSRVISGLKNHGKVCRLSQHQLRNCFGGKGPQCRRRRESGWLLMAFIFYGAQRGT